MPAIPRLTPPTPLTSKHLTFRVLTAADVPAVAAIRTQPQVNHFLSHGAMSQAQLETRMHLRVARMAVSSEAEATCQFAVIETKTADIVGDCGYTVKPVWTQNDQPTEHLEARIHYAFSPDVAGRGFATEAVGVLVEHLYAEPRIHRIQADVFADNTASRRVLEKNGFRCEGTFEDDGLIDGEFVDACFYSLLRKHHRLNPG